MSLSLNQIVGNYECLGIISKPRSGLTYRVRNLATGEMEALRALPGAAGNMRVRITFTAGPNIFSVDNRTPTVRGLAHRDVVIAKRPNGHVQITCTPQQHLVPKIKQAIVCLRKKEATLLGLELSPEESAAEEQLVANWYIPHFGGGLNGSLTNPKVEPTRQTLKEIYQTVCNALW